MTWGRQQAWYDWERDDIDIGTAGWFYVFFFFGLLGGGILDWIGQLMNSCKRGGICFILYLFIFYPPFSIFKMTDCSFDLSISSIFCLVFLSFSHFLASSKSNSNECSPFFAFLLLVLSCIDLH